MLVEAQGLVHVAVVTNRKKRTVACEYYRGIFEIRYSTRELGYVSGNGIPTCLMCVAEKARSPFTR